MFIIDDQSDLILKVETPLSSIHDINQKDNNHPKRFENQELAEI